MFNSLEEAIAFGNKKDEDGGIPIFRWEAEEQADGTFKDVAHVKILNKGDPKSIIDRPVRDDDKTRRWPKHWKAFVENAELPLDGVPLKEWPMMSPALIATCNRFHIRTVEDMAEYPDVHLHNLGSRGVTLKREAKKYLEYRSGGSNVDTLRAENASLKARLEALEQKIGLNTDDVPERIGGDGMAESVDTGGEQQSGRKANTGARKKSRKKPGD